jgi:hypothetical protein
VVATRPRATLDWSTYSSQTPSGGSQRADPGQKHDPGERKPLIYRILLAIVPAPGRPSTCRRNRRFGAAGLRAKASSENDEAARSATDLMYRQAWGQANIFAADTRAIRPCSMTGREKRVSDHPMKGGGRPRAEPAARTALTVLGDYLPKAIEARPCSSDKGLDKSSSSGRIIAPPSLTAER